MHASRPAQARQWHMPEGGTPPFPASLGLEERLDALAEAARATAAEASGSETALHAAGLCSARDIARLAGGWTLAEREALENAWSELEQASSQAWGAAADLAHAQDAASKPQRKRLREVI